MDIAEVHSSVVQNTWYFFHALQERGIHVGALRTSSRTICVFTLIVIDEVKVN